MFTRPNYAAGVAAGMEHDSIDDEFMFADDTFHDGADFSEPVIQTSDAKKNIAVTTEAPWINSLLKPKKKYSSNVPHDVHMDVEDDNMRAAITKGDISYVMNSLESGFQVTRQILTGWTGLMYAANSAQAIIVKLFIDHGADVNFQTNLFTPLMALCTSFSKNEQSILACATYLLEAGAKVNAHDRHLVTPLMLAAERGRSDLIDLLVQKKAKINAQDNRGWTPLAFAAQSGHKRAVLSLLRNEVDITVCAYDGQTAADLAYSKGFPSIAEVLDNPKIKSKGKEGGFPAIRSPRPTETSSGSKYKKLEELEMFLFGLDLGHLVENFQVHRLSFQDFLKITDEELIQIGINELGARRKILETIRGVHTNKWNLSGLTIENNLKISSIEAAAIITNIAKHLACIHSSVTYLYDYMKKNRDFIQQDEQATQKVLVIQCKDAVQESNLLQSDLIELLSFMNKELPLALQERCNYINARKMEHTVSRSSNLVKPLAFVTLCSFIAVVGVQLIRRFYR